MTENVWSNEYKQWNIAPTIQLPARHVTLLDFWENSFQKFSSRTAFIFKDKNSLSTRLSNIAVNLPAFTTSSTTSR